MQRCARHKAALLAALFVLCVLARLFSPAVAMAANETRDSLATTAEELEKWASAQELTGTTELPSEELDGSYASVRVFQWFESSYTGVERTFEYRMAAMDGDAPMPAGTQDGVYSWTFTGDDSGWINIPFDGLSVSEGERVYRYILFQHVENPQPGYTYDSTRYALEVHVLANADTPVAVVKNPDGTKPADPGWTVHYDKPTQNEDDTSQESESYQSSYVPARSAEKLSHTGDPLIANGVVVLVAATGLILIGLFARRRGGGEGNE